MLIIHKADETAKAQIAAIEMRKKGIRTDVYMLPDKKMKQIFEYAEKNSIPYSLTFSGDKCILKCHATRETREYDNAASAADGVALA